MILSKDWSPGKPPSLDPSNKLRACHSSRYGQIAVLEPGKELGRRAIVATEAGQGKECVYVDGYGCAFAKDTKLEL